MATQTILYYLHSIDPIKLSFTELDEHAHVIKTELDVNLSHFIPHEAKKIIVVLPSLEILLTRAELPKLTRRRLRQAIPFAIEEQLIDDVTESHFSMGEYTEDFQWPTAVVSLQKMNQWTETLDRLKIYPNKIVPAVLALPFHEDRWTVYCLDNLCFVRTDVYTGFSCEPANLAVYLEAKLSEETKKPVQIDVYAEEKISLSLTTNCPVIYSKVPQKKLVESLAYALKTQPTINLLQGSFRSKRKSVEAKKLWTYAGYVTLAWIALAFTSNLFSLLLLHYRASSIDHKILTIYKRNFSDASAAIAPQEQMEEKLRKISSQASNESFLVLLANVGKAYAQSNGPRLLNLNYLDKQLTLEISASNFDELDAFTHALQQNQLNVKQQHAEMIAGRVKATLQIF